MDNSRREDHKIRPGYRLQRLEVFNWGTFDSQTGEVHSIALDGHAALLVGQNGSGKSTLIDALLTLLVPSAIRNYNVAAGAKKTERGERSYARGAYARGGEDTVAGATKFLRPESNTYSALLAVFTDTSSQESFTLCQVLHPTSDGGIEKTYALATESRGIADDLSGIDGIDAARARLRQCGYRVTRKYNEYEQWIARRAGLRPKAMDMFNQTVAVKDIQSLNEFVRRHMLEAHDWRDKVRRLLSHFDELSNAHRALGRVQKAAELLVPIRRSGESYQRLSGELTETQRLLEAGDAYFRYHTVRLLTPELNRAQEQLVRVEGQKSDLAERIRMLGENIHAVRSELEGAVGQRGRVVPWLIERERVALDATKREFTRFHDACRICGIDDVAVDESRFQAIRARLATTVETEAEQLHRWLVQRETIAAQKYSLDQRCELLSDELATLVARASNLPLGLQSVRRTMCEALGVQESELPFAAELMEIPEAELAWRPAIEMVLRRFALSLLVTDHHYATVCSYVERHPLVDARGRGQRLVYLRVGSDDQVPHGVEAHEFRGERRSVVDKLVFHPEHPLALWVRNEVVRRFDYQCCDTLQEFQQATRLAITKNRHTKSHQRQHEKDDRPEVCDPRSFVLGWDSRNKQTELTGQLAELKRQRQSLLDQLGKLDGHCEASRQRIEAAKQATEMDSFALLDVNRHLHEIAALEAELSSDASPEEVKGNARQRLATLESQWRRSQEERDAEIAHEAELRQSIRSLQNHIGERPSVEIALEKMRASGVDDHLMTAWDALHEEQPLTSENLIERERVSVKLLNRRVGELRQRMDPIAERIVAAMSRYLREFPEQQEDLDASLDALPSFMGRLTEIECEDLPRHQHRFQERLNDKISQELALFYAALRADVQVIEEKLAQLNQSLAELEYRPGTFMRLEMKPVDDREIADFQKRMRECLDDSLNSDEDRREARYRRIEDLVGRLADDQRSRWREKVVDVRRWYDFVACEIDRESGRVLSCYQDSSGQSGGEKAKLAFTILVAAIAYQYDLNPNRNEPGKFHFVCVDEMFSKVDDIYAEYAMRLFDQFGLQLLIVAPLDAKARVVEPFVDRYLHVVKDEKSHHSRVFGITANEYEAVSSPFE